MLLHSKTRVSTMCGTSTINEWDIELKEMNKVGIEPLQYPNTFLAWLCQSILHLSYRQTEEDFAQGHIKGKVPSFHDCTTINRKDKLIKYFNRYYQR